MNILDKIIVRKREEVALAKETTSLAELEKFPLFDRKTYSLRESIVDKNRSGIIAEFKRASPSKGIINDKSTVKDVARGYELAGASAISVLTDADFFKGSLQDLTEARDAVTIPVLRKEFVIDRYQIAEAKAYGADVILLIAAVLSSDEIKDLSCYAKELGLSVLLEVHNKEELDRSIFDSIDAIGVNNRNLKDFTVSIQHSLDLVNLIPDSFIKVSESGISDPESIIELKEAGFQAFLIGENFMKTDNPQEAISSFINQIKA
ncbi:MAG TPA: indole-3-glycerol phosphate synthase TrpC [Sphingobacteriaceae bacterium]|nr:indole-3-glycerol phosphate synthase TrpC [Sphingobacteriaceae bacterium]